MIKKNFYIFFIFYFSCHYGSLDSGKFVILSIGCGLISQSIYEFSKYSFLKMKDYLENSLRLWRSENGVFNENLLDDTYRKYEKHVNNKQNDQSQRQLTPTEIFLHNQSMQKSNVSWREVFINQDTKDDILQFARLFFDINRSSDIKVPEILFLYGLPGMDKSNIVKGLGFELDIPVIVIDPIALPNDFKMDVLIRYIESQGSPCILFFKDFERFVNDKAFLLKMYYMFHFGFSSVAKPKHKVLVCFSCNQDYIINDLNLHQSVYSKLVIIKYPDVASREDLIQSIFNMYDKYIDFSYINIFEIAQLFKNLTNKDIKNIISESVNDLLSEYSLQNGNFHTFNKKIYCKKNDFFIQYKKYMQNKMIVNSRESVINKGLLEFNLILAEKSNVFFEDVIGLEHIKKKLKLYIDYLKNPDLYRQLGIELPHGILFVGAPGCGKTLLAKALASESGVFFLSLSGSDFIDKYVGSGASKIREVFNAAKGYGAAFIYIDEIDAIAMKKSSSSDGGEKEYTQTINALLVEMDGFNTKDSSNQIIVIGSTNRKLEDLEPSLLRRFEDKYYFSLPTFKDRENIIKYYTNDVVLSSDVSIRELAAKTIGYSGSEIVTLCKNAKYYAIQKVSVEEGMKNIFVSNEDFINAYYENVIGHLIPSFEVSEKLLRETAIHEIGHTLCQLYAENIFIKNENSFALRENIIGSVNDNQPYAFELVTIEPRSVGNGTVFGFSSQIKASEYLCLTSRELKKNIIISLGGYCAEKLFLGQSTEGVGSDLEKANFIARRMVFLGMENSLFIPSDETSLTKEQIEQVEGILQSSLDECNAFLEYYADLLLFLSNKLLEKKILYREEVIQLINDFLLVR